MTFFISRWHKVCFFYDNEWIFCTRGVLSPHNDTKRNLWHQKSFDWDDMHDNYFKENLMVTHEKGKLKEYLISRTIERESWTWTLNSKFTFPGIFLCICGFTKSKPLGVKVRDFYCELFSFTLGNFSIISLLFPVIMIIIIRELLLSCLWLKNAHFEVDIKNCNCSNIYSFAHFFGLFNKKFPVLKAPSSVNISKENFFFL